MELQAHGKFSYPEKITWDYFQACISATIYALHCMSLWLLSYRKIDRVHRATVEDLDKYIEEYAKSHICRSKEKADCSWEESYQATNQPTDHHSKLKYKSLRNWLSWAATGF